MKKKSVGKHSRGDRDNDEPKRDGYVLEPRDAATIGVGIVINAVFQIHARSFGICGYEMKA